jgi:hypothetical protein
LGSVNMNRNSALLRLPTEIRQEIWKYVLGGKTYLATCFGGRYYSGDYKFAPSAAETCNGMVLLRTCRQIYSEAVLYPFIKATFAYHNLTYLMRSVQALRPYQRKLVTQLRIDCRRQNHTPGVEDSGLLSDHETEIKKLFPAVAHITVLIHGITDADRSFDDQPFEASVEMVSPHFRKLIETTGATLVVGSTHDEIEAREVDEMDDANNEDD